MDWFLYDNGLRHERVNVTLQSFQLNYFTPIPRFILILSAALKNGRTYLLCQYICHTKVYLAIFHCCNILNKGEKW